MITWLPYPDFIESVGALENHDLLKSCEDSIAILDIFHQVRQVHPNWTKHPAVRMWASHEVSLIEYGLLAYEEIFARKIGTKPTREEKREKLEQHMEWATSGNFLMDKPPWFGQPELHLSHQSNLIRHNVDAYGIKFYGVPMDLPYVWPVSSG